MLHAAFFFHNNLGDPHRALMFIKNVSITGAFLLLLANGAGSLTVDNRVSWNARLQACAALGECLALPLTETRVGLSRYRRN